MSKLSIKINESWQSVAPAINAGKLYVKVNEAWQPVSTEVGSTIFTDFSEYTVGSAPVGWTPRWAGGDWKIVEDTTAPSGKVLRCVSDTSSVRRLLTWDAADSMPARHDVEVVTQWKALTPTSALAGVRLFGSTTTAQGYAAGSTSDSKIAITSYFDGTASNTQVALAQQSGIWYRTRLQARGTTVRQRTWLASDPEPTVWDITLNDGRDELGWVGLFTFTGASSGTISRDFAYIGVGTGAEPAPSLPAAPAVEPPPTEEPVVATVTSITVRDITFTFSKATRAGQFINGDWFVVPDAGDSEVVITRITPDPDFTSGAERNGVMVNVSASGQAYHSGRSYDASLNKAAMPLSVIPGQSVIKGMSRVSTTYSQPPDLEDAVVLTCLASVPNDGAAGGNTFRPPYYGGPTNKRQFLWSDVVTANLPSLAPPANVTLPTLEQVRKRFANVQLDHRSNWLGRYLHPIRSFMSLSGADSVSNYGSKLGRDNQDALLRLMLNDPIEDKKPALIAVLQACIDWYGYFKAGGTLPADGGHGVGRKSMVVFGAVLFNDADMKDVCKLRSTDEDKHLRRSAKTNMVLFGRSFGSSGFDSWRLERNGSKDIADNLELVDGGTPSSGYQYCCTSRIYVAEALVIRLLPGGPDVLGSDLLLEYADRWMDFGGWADDRDMNGNFLGRTWLTSSGTLKDCRDYHGMNKAGGHYGSGFQAAMWDEYRLTKGPISWIRRSGTANT